MTETAELTEMQRQIILHAKPHMKGHHDFAHYTRVYDFAHQIWEKEGGDWEVIFAGCWLHDIGRSINHLEHSRIGAGMAKEILQEIKFPEAKIGAVVAAILRHDQYRGQETIEEMIVSDAEHLDCFSHIGLIRCLLETFKTKRSIDLLELAKKVDSHLQRAFKSLKTKTAQEIASGFKRSFLDHFLLLAIKEQETASA